MLIQRIALASAVIGASLALSSGALAQLRGELGKFEYETNCIVCHGPVGKGDGLFVDNLKLKVPDLTTVAERNKGVFPAERLSQIIDGRMELVGHGSRQMPIWGGHYNDKAAEYYKGFAYNPEQFIRVRILSLIDYIYQLQTRR